MPSPRKLPHIIADVRNPLFFGLVQWVIGESPLPDDHFSRRVEFSVDQERPDSGPNNGNRLARRREAAVPGIRRILRTAISPVIEAVSPVFRWGQLPPITLLLRDSNEKDRHIAVLIQERRYHLRHRVANRKSSQFELEKTPRPAYLSHLIFHALPVRRKCHRNPERQENKNRQENETPGRISGRCLGSGSDFSFSQHKAFVRKAWNS